MRHSTLFVLLVCCLASTGHCLAADLELDQVDENSPSKTIRETIALSSPQSPYVGVHCAGMYRHHLQGICTNEKNSVYWSFTTTLVKTDSTGKVLKKVPVANHHGDLCHYDGKLYVAVNLGRFNDPKGNADSWVYVYDARDLSFVAKHKTPEVFHGAGGMAYHDKKFIVVGGLPDGVQENYAYEYDRNFKFTKKHVIKSGHTQLGIQTAAFADGHWWFGCYGKKLIKTDASFKMVGKYDFDCGLGIIGVSPNRFLIARGGGTGEKRTGRTLIGIAEEKKGLVFPPASD